MKWTHLTTKRGSLLLFAFATATVLGCSAAPMTPAVTPATTFPSLGSTPPTNDPPTLGPTATRLPTAATPTLGPTERPAPTLRLVPTPRPPVKTPSPTTTRPTASPAPTPVPTPRPIRTGTLGNWHGTGPTTIPVSGTSWNYAEMSWSCTNSGTFAIDPFISSDGLMGSLEINFRMPQVRRSAR